MNMPGEGRIMSRIVVLGLTVLVLAACKPADQTAQPEAAAPVAATSAPQPSASVSWEAMQDRYRQVEVAPSDPLEALERRAVLCAHYSGEFGGDGSERDQWLNTQMDELRCGDELIAEARAMRDARSGEPGVIARLDTVLGAFE
ncbi:hypothetical protein [Brevundimonas sp. Root1423]|uniref:hypothetical protein n=1 Tax=Brevundimonas sp. Root1423 TaxID=1736462 RepID=UPI0006F23DF4|nr:hypothetical protein [Brevundimonas sp. Root1423]KQY84807.1 hypothetical protein ASD25_07250 [Brevundimonas sp. Root1423]